MKGVINLASNAETFDDVLAEVADHPNVRQVLSRVPDASRRRNGDSARIPSKSDRSVLTVYRDPQDVRTIFSLTRLLAVLSLIIVASAAANIFQYLRRPDRIVVDGSTGRVLSINDRNYGREERVEFGPDRLTTEDKLYATKEFARYLYQVDPATRSRDVEKALRMMVPNSAVTFSNWIKTNGILDQQKAESWQAVWTVIDISVDPNNSYTINVIGRQQITKVVNGTVQKDSKQLRLTVLLIADPQGRSDRSLRTGFLVAKLDAHELPDNTAPSSTKAATDSKTDQSATSTNERQ